MPDQLPYFALIKRKLFRTKQRTSWNVGLVQVGLANVELVTISSKQYKSGLSEDLTQQGAFVLTSMLERRFDTHVPVYPCTYLQLNASQFVFEVGRVPGTKR